MRERLQGKGPCVKMKFFATGFLCPMNGLGQHLDWRRSPGLLYSDRPARVEAVLRNSPFEVN